MGKIFRENKFYIIAALTLAMLIVPGAIAFSAGVNMQEGKWEITMETKMEGMPIQMQPMKFTLTQCLTKEDAVPKTTQKDQKCEVIDQKIIGNRVKWKIKCVEKKTTSVGEGDITYSGAGYSGTMKTKVTDESGKTFTSSTKMSGRRIGNCDK